MSRPSSRRAGFTLVELLVVIGIIAVLISILLPALQRARDSAATIKCAANVRSIVQGLLAYAAESKQYLPASYNYTGTSVNINTGIQVPNGSQYGYSHWSGYLLDTVPAESFLCPALNNGGLPPTDPAPGNFDASQTLDSNDNANTYPLSSNTGLLGRITAVTGIDGTGTSQTYYPDNYGRIAYTLNEALCPRNKYCVFSTTGKSLSALRTYHNIQLSAVDNQTGTILVTEFINNADIVSGNTTGGASHPCKSHRPVSGWRAAGYSFGDEDKSTTGTNYCDPSAIATATALRHTMATDSWHMTTPNAAGANYSVDLISDYQQGFYCSTSACTDRGSKLDWVGRNHGYGVKPADKKTNFGYVDGHVETKSILETLAPALGADGNVPATPWEWGSRHFTISPNAIDSSQDQ